MERKSSPGSHFTINMDMKVIALFFEAIRAALTRIESAEREERIARRFLALAPDIQEGRTAADFRVIFFDMQQIIIDELEPNKGPNR